MSTIKLERIAAQKSVAELANMMISHASINGLLDSVKLRDLVACLSKNEDFQLSKKLAELNEVISKNNREVING